MTATALKLLADNPLWIAKGILFAYLTWILFLAVMALNRARQDKTLITPVYYAALPIVAVAVVCDFLLNILVSVPLAELPQYQKREWMLTVRCERLLTTRSGYRYRVARSVCRYLLDPFQQGGHCHEPVSIQPTI